MSSLTPTESICVDYVVWELLNKAADMDFHTGQFRQQVMLLSSPPAPHTRHSTQRGCEVWEPPMRSGKEQAVPTACSPFMCDRWTSYHEGDLLFTKFCLI